MYSKSFTARTQAKVLLQKGRVNIFYIAPIFRAKVNSCEEPAALVLWGRWLARNQPSCAG